MGENCKQNRCFSPQWHNGERMEKKKTKHTIPLDFIRGLIVEQKGKCAITGLPLNPQEVNADHIIPLSRKELSPSVEEENIWLVHKKANTMKGTMSYAEFVDMCKAVLEHYEESNRLLNRIRNKRVKPISKDVFDQWVEENCGEDGKIRS